MIASGGTGRGRTETGCLGGRAGGAGGGVHMLGKQCAQARERKRPRPVTGGA